MSRFTKAALAVLLTLATAAVGAQQPAATVADSAPAGADLPAVYAVVDRFADALKAADFDAVRDALAEDAVIFEMGGVERSREEYLGHHAIGDASFLAGATVTVRHRTGQVAGDVAWVATESEIVPKASAASARMSTETMVLRRDRGAWRIAHIHWSSRASKEAP